jgi:hypothetical protein
MNSHQQVKKETQQDVVFRSDPTFTYNHMEEENELQGNYIRTDSISMDNKKTLFFILEETAIVLLLAAMLLFSF